MALASLSGAKRVASAPAGLAKVKARPGTRLIGSQFSFVGPAPRLGTTTSPHRSELQTKLKVGEPNARSEQEADRAADGAERSRSTDSSGEAYGGTPDGGAYVGTPNGGGVAALPISTPRLEKNTVFGPVLGPHGAFAWGAQWSIRNADANTDGWIVQHLQVRQNVTDANGSPVVTARGGYGGLDVSLYPVWEAWAVRKGLVYIGSSNVPHSGGRGDVYGQTPVGPSTRGTTGIDGKADFYPNLTLPSSFKVTGAEPTWDLPATKTDPRLTNGTGTLDHQAEARWDSVAGSSTTKLTTV
jgi:hypothetical protein